MYVVCSKPVGKFFIGIVLKDPYPTVDFNAAVKNFLTLGLCATLM